ncbi:ABC transporter permease [Anaerotignum sp.]|uniref:ABC transporter permease n=1 Tax=Anaerotignum sp. TaxID=2039241 RepID=UPI0027151CC2|nr:ABC transporter permease [Anaerotignum sp.]
MSYSEFLTKHFNEILKALLVHIEIVFISVGIGVIIAVPLGIVLSRHKSIAKYVLAVVGVIQTIPGLVLLGIMLILFGIGKPPAIAALSLYAILPILRNTYIGITEVDMHYIEAAKGIGMSGNQILFKVELPLSMPAIIGGLRLSTVYIISWATLAGMIGAGGLGDMIWTGLSSYETKYILAGAIPAAILALVASALIGFIQRAITPKGLRIRR